MLFRSFVASCLSDEFRLVRYEAFMPGLFTSSVGLFGGYGIAPSGVAPAEELEWLHRLLLTYLDSESHAFGTWWIRHHRDEYGFGRPVRPLKPLTPSQAIKALNGGFTAAAPCLSVARLLAEASVLIHAGHMGTATRFAATSCTGSSQGDRCGWRAGLPLFDSGR